MVGERLIPHPTTQLSVGRNLDWWRGTRSWELAASYILKGSEADFSFRLRGLPYSMGYWIATQLIILFMMSSVLFPVPKTERVLGDTARAHSYPLHETSNFTGSTNQGCLANLAAVWRSFWKYDRTTLNRLDICFASVDEVFGEGFSPFHISLSATISSRVRTSLSTDENVIAGSGFQNRVGSDLM